MPRVVGEFDAELLQANATRALEEVGEFGHNRIQGLLASEKGSPYMTMSQIAEIKWKRLFIPEAYESFTIDGQVDDLEILDNPSKGPVDEWHPDNLGGDIFDLPRILTGASIYPTLFLVGRIALPGEALRHIRSFDFWRSEGAKIAIEKAIEKGNARPVHFLPGQIVVAHPGTLHKRDLPEDASGIRYFMRKFPKLGLGYTGNAFGRLRLL